MSQTELVEISLLTGAWDAAITLDTPIVQLAKHVVQGNFKHALTSPEARAAITLSTTLDQTQPIDALFDFQVSPPPDADIELLRLTLAVAALHAFVQANWTGPDLDVKPTDVIPFPAAPAPQFTDQILDAKAITELAYAGEPAYHLAASPAFLRLAQILLNLPYQHVQSAPWWRLRATLVQQQLLDDAVAPPDELLASLSSLTESIATPARPDVAGQLLLERGLLAHHLAQDKAAAELFVQAARATGLNYELTGAMGKRTKFQETAHSQLVLLAESRPRDGDPGAEGAEGADGPGPAGNADQDASVPETMALNDDTLLEQTEFTSSNPSAAGSPLAHLDPASQPPLHPLDQCILLALCLNVSNTSPAHGLTSEQMAPYVARVVAHPRNWSVHTMALLLRARLEAGRTRTVERSTFQLQALVQQMPTADSAVAERLRCVHAIALPSKWEMERELALRFLSLGVVQSALEIFERLEMWEEVVKCWQNMERTDKALAIVRDLLEGRKEEADTVIARGKQVPEKRREGLDAARAAKLWCLLGDLEPEHAEAHYTQAWAVSGETAGRAMRSLGGLYFARGTYPEAIKCLRRAVSINPLFSRSWFILGCAYIRLEDWAGGKEAFARCVGIDDEDGESWNNLASMYLRMGTADEDAAESVPFHNKMLAFQAMKQGLKFAYENWRMWANYMVICMDVGELSEACRAMHRVVEERCAKVGAESVDADVLDRLVDAVTRAAPANPDGAPAVRLPNEGHGLLPRVVDLFERTLLPRVSSARVFRAYGRLLMWQGRWEDALKANLDGYRCGAAGTLEKGEVDAERWREALREVEDIVGVLRNFGPRVAGFNWQFQGRSLVRTFIARSKEFEDEPEWARLTELQDELRKVE
ncbi:TPR-like protein [Athelia psychrophila]|uniref:TPR-like protein n=1 Tax=Athelia psychrophila TaxID=1759441 RepID=A0A166K7G1_9AGAM|nr:TPR-like protein [Fibularhizoctonia sp. CBS 109695]